MIPFLRQVAQHYLAAGDIEKTVFVFPNRRSLTFFRKYLGDACCSEGAPSTAGPRRPLLEPELLTISDFFCKVTGKRTCDRISLLTRLYDHYRKLNPAAETLDDFIYWGDVILGDFDDIDKYLVRAESLFANISDLKDIRDDYSYMTPEQTAAVRRLAGHFSPENWARRSDGDVKSGFLQIWRIMLPLYQDFKASLAAGDLAYEGMIYREFAERLENESVSDILSASFDKTERFVFVGLNALNECEKTVMRRMKNAGLAEFCWDFPGHMISDPDNAASHFMRGNIEMFGNAFDAEGGDSVPKVHVIAVPSATGQAKLLPRILEGVPEGDRGLDFAVVLPDETMLMPVVNSIPDSIRHINITMGYPLASSEFCTLMREIGAMQMHLRNKDGRWYFYSRQVHSILSSGIVKSIMGEGETATASAIRKAAKFYIPKEDFGTSPLFSTIFRPVARNLTLADAEQTDSIAAYLLDCAAAIARLLPEKDTLQVEYARQYYCSVNVLRQKHLALLPQTWMHLVSQVCSGRSVPFEGDPLGGLQVMGPLETRALDFRHMVIMSCSEGVFPRRSVSSSFIPPELRKAFGLPTYEYQDAVWAYYFYRMIARAENVWMLYDSRTEGLKSGEESRYIKQLRHLYRDFVQMDECIAKASAGENAAKAEIDKTDEDIETMRQATYSASLIQKYLECPVKFYYYMIKGLRPSKEATEEIDSALLGEICHDTLMAIYSGEEAVQDGGDFDKRNSRDVLVKPKTIDRAYLESWMRRGDEIKGKIHSLIRAKLHVMDVSGKNLVDAEVTLRFVMKVMERDIELIGEHGPITLLGLEKNYPPIEICGHRFTGYIDRMDCFGDGDVRVVDYKTGSDDPEVLCVDDIARFNDDLFVKHANGWMHKKAALQFHIYDKFVAHDRKLAGREIRNSMYAMKSIFTDKVAIYPRSLDYMSDVDERLAELFEELEDKSVPFRRTEKEDDCKFCDYKSLCGRFPKK